MILYLCGSISADPDYRAKFDRHEKALTDAGHTVLNPRRHTPAVKSWLGYMRLGVTALASADGVALIPGWEQGDGSVIEFNLAHQLGIPAKPCEQWVADSDTVSAHLDRLITQVRDAC